MNYKKIIEQAAQKRDFNKKLTKEKEMREVKEYIEKIKKLKNRIEILLGVEKLLQDNKFLYNDLCTDCMYHRLGFAFNKNGIGIYAGGACGVWDLIVDNFGIALMHGMGTVRNPDYRDIPVLKRFVNQFDDFEIRVQNFVSSL